MSDFNEHKLGSAEPWGGGRGLARTEAMRRQGFGDYSAASPGPRRISPPRILQTGLYITAVGLVFLFLSASQSSAGQGEALAADFLRLKTAYEEQAEGLAGSPDKVSCLGAETAARAWALAALSLAGGQEDQARWRERLKLFEIGEIPEEPELRLLADLWLYFDAFYESALSLAARGELRSLESELRSVRAEAIDKLKAVRDKPGAVWEKKNIIAEALARQISATANALGGAPMRRPTGEIMARLADKTGEISKRTDLHYRARMRLLYLAYLRELTSLTFLVGLSAGPPLSGQMASIHAELNRQGPALASETHSEGLLWTAQAQAAIPLAYWAATVGREDNEDSAGAMGRSK